MTSWPLGYPRAMQATFNQGDAVIFGMHLLHGSLTNVSQSFRISCDTRWQRATDLMDERWAEGGSRGASTEQQNVSRSQSTNEHRSLFSHWRSHRCWEQKCINHYIKCKNVSKQALKRNRRILCMIDFQAFSAMAGMRKIWGV